MSNKNNKTAPEPNQPPLNNEVILSVNPSTLRGRKRREKLRRLGLTEVRVDATFTEKEMFKRTAKAMGYSDTAEMLMMETKSNAERHGITLESIHSEGKR